MAFVKRQNVTAKQERFIAEYLVDFNGRQAAIRAGYSKKGAAQHAARLLTSIPIRSAIESRRQTALEAIGLTTERVLKEVADVALAETSEPPKTSEKLKALEIAGKHLGLFRERIEHSGPNGAPIEYDNVAMARWIAFRFEVARLELEKGPGDASSS